MDDRSQRLIEKADRALAKNNVTSALLALNKVRRHFPDAAELLIRDAQIAFANNDIPSGTQLLIALSQRADLSATTRDTLIRSLENYELYFPLREITERLVSSHPDDLSSRIQLGQLYLQTGAVAESIDALQHCVSLSPDEANIHLQLGHAFKAFSDTEQAASAYHRYIELAPQFAGTGYWSLADLKHYSFTEADARAMKNLQLDNPYQTALLTFALQRLAEQQQSTDAVALLRKANNLISQSRPFHLDGFQRLARDVKYRLPPSVAEQADTSPIFIVGLPRSGTTLTEQILAAHSNVATTDELPFIERVAIYLTQKGYYPSNLHALPESERQRCRDFYLQQAYQYPVGDAPRFIDKNPNNFIHVGLIHTLFPQASILCLSRPVMDNLASIYRQMFSKGNNYAYQPDHLLAYSASFYQLMQFWQRELPDVLTIIDYEALVADTEKTITYLLERCGLQFESQCLRFYELDTAVLTPSASQVRQPVNNKSLGSGERYRELFESSTPRPEDIEEQRRALLSLTD